MGYSYIKALLLALALLLAFTNASASGGRKSSRRTIVYLDHGHNAPKYDSNRTIPTVSYYAGEIRPIGELRKFMEEKLEVERAAKRNKAS